jgi:phenylalanyl-tRNA synthetase beta chain
VHRFTARVIRNVKIGASPEWLVKRLEAIGERSINNVADITNYVMHELGQPMHSFDFNKLAENRIVVRRARPGETIKTLDEAERKLDETMLMICDAEKPVAVGGVMGGFDSGITEEHDRRSAGSRLFQPRIDPPNFAQAETFDRSEPSFRARR